MNDENLNFRNKERNITFEFPSMPSHKVGKVTYTQEVIREDPETGEYKVEKHVVNRRGTKEPNFLKVYYDTMCAFQGISGIPSDVLLALCGCVEGYINAPNEPLIFRANKTNRSKMCEKLDMSESMVRKYVKKMVDAGVLIKIEKQRGEYYVNPWLMARGKWENIKELQCCFDFVDGSWHVKCDADIKS